MSTLLGEVQRTIMQPTPRMTFDEVSHHLGCRETHEGMPLLRPGVRFRRESLVSPNSVLDCTQSFPSYTACSLYRFECLAQLPHNSEIDKDFVPVIHAKDSSWIIVLFPGSGKITS